MKKITRHYSKFILLLIILFLSLLLFGCEEVITFGSIHIVSTPPGAKVYLDGVDTGFVTPVTLNDISTGPHSVKLELYHYKTKEEDVLVLAGETTPLNLTLIYAYPVTLTIQNFSEGKDAYVSSAYVDTNFNKISTWVGKLEEMITTVYRTYLQFDPGGVPDNAVVTEAILWVYQHALTGSGNFGIGLYRVTGEWEEETLTWNNQPSSSSEVEDIFINPNSIGIWRSWDIGHLVQGWHKGEFENYGMLLKAIDEETLNTVAGFYTSDYADDTSKCPKLEIHYYIP